MNSKLTPVEASEAEAIIGHLGAIPGMEDIVRLHGAAQYRAAAETWSANTLGSSWSRVPRHEWPPVDERLSEACRTLMHLADICVDNRRWWRALNWPAADRYLGGSNPSWVVAAQVAHPRPT